jgi:hypothetical protein
MARIPMAAWICRGEARKRGFLFLIGRNLSSRHCLTGFQKRPFLAVFRYVYSAPSRFSGMVLQVYLCLYFDFLTVQLGRGWALPAVPWGIGRVVPSPVFKGEGPGATSLRLETGAACERWSRACPPTLRKKPRRMGHPELWGWLEFSSVDAPPAVLRRSQVPKSEAPGAPDFLGRKRLLTLGTRATRPFVRRRL